VLSSDSTIVSHSPKEHVTVLNTNNAKLSMILNYGL
jgi:hypothetical protein